MISIKETFGIFNSGQFESFTSPSTFVSLSFLFLICILLPFALSAFEGPCPYWALVVHFYCFTWIVYTTKTTLPFKGSNRECVSLMHSKGSCILFHSDIHLVFCYLIVKHTSMYSQISTRICYCCLWFSHLFCQKSVLFLQGHQMDYPRGFN